LFLTRQKQWEKENLMKLFFYEDEIKEKKNEPKMLF